MYGFNDYVIVFFSKGHKEIVHKCYVGGTYIDIVHERAEKMFYTIPDAHYYEVFTQEQFKRICCL